MADKASQKAGLGRRLKWRLEVLAYDLVGILMIPFPFAVISKVGGWLVRLIGPMTSKHKIARIGLKTAFPDASEEQISIWLKGQWDNIGRTFAEFPIMHRVKVFDGDRVTVEGVEHLETLMKSEQPAIMVGGHFANWEIMGATLTQYGLPIQITYRKINNPYFDKRVRSQRQAYGIKLLVAKSGAKGAKQIFAALAEGESIGLMNDQKFNEGMAIPFFGVEAMTAPGPTRLALKAGAPLLLVSITRDKARFNLKVHDPVFLKKTGDRHADIRQGVEIITKFIEDRIRDDPSQWFWVHRRWPKEHYKSKALMQE